MVPLRPEHADLTGVRLLIGNRWAWQQNTFGRAVPAISVCFCKRRETTIFPKPMGAAPLRSFVRAGRWPLPARLGRLKPGH